MISLAELGEIAKADEPRKIEGYRAGKVSAKLPARFFPEQVYFSEEKGAKKRRTARALIPAVGGVAGMGAVAAVTRGKGWRVPKKGSIPSRIWNSELELDRYHKHYLPGMLAGLTVGGHVASKKNYSSGDVRAYDRKTGERRDYGLWGSKKWGE